MVQGVRGDREQAWVLTRLPATWSQLRKSPSPFRAALGGVSEGPLVRMGTYQQAVSGRWAGGRAGHRGVVSLAREEVRSLPGGITELWQDGWPAPGAWCYRMR